MNDFYKRVISEDEICSIIKRKSPDISEIDLKWKLHHYIKDNSLVRIGSKKYINAVNVYNYEYESTLTLSIDEYLSNTFPDIKIVLWESRQLNEWLNLLININIIYIEVEKDYVDYVFSSLNDVYGSKHLILLNPKQDDLSRYLRDDLIVVKSLFSKSPINKTSRKIRLEKMAVDILANDYLLDTRSIEDVVLGIKNTHCIDMEKALSYASRRRIKEKLQELWKVK